MITRLIEADEPFNMRVIAEVAAKNIMRGAGLNGKRKI